MNELRRLTWKYFFKQKWKEIKKELELIIFLSMMISFIFILTGFLEFIGLGILCFWILIGIINLIKYICKWIKSNWMMAKEKAEQELNISEEIDIRE